MCGLVGVVSKRPNGFTREHQDIFSTLLFVDTFRGKDATGVFCVSNEGDVYVAKDVGYAPRFMGSKEYEEAQKRAWNRGAALIGHNRAATRGKIDDMNAHPFNVDNNIVLVHNGTMRGNHRKHADVEVDSHAIAHLIHEKGNVTDALEGIDAAYALIWYDVAKAELNMIRNDERPLYWMELDDAWLWASETTMLEFAVNRVGGVKVKTEPTALPVDTLQTFKLENHIWSATANKVTIKKPEPPPMQGGYYGSSSIMGGASMGGNGGRRDSRYYDDLSWNGEDVLEEPPFRRSLTGAEWVENNRELAWERAQAANRSSGSGEVTYGKHPTHGYPGQTRSGGVDGVQPKPARRTVEAREPHPFAGVEEREKAMARKLNKRVTHGEYQQVLSAHPFNVGVHCAPFDYAYVNGENPTDGYYLYASPFDDEDIILRQWFSAQAVTEDRMIQLAGTDYVYEFTLGIRQWSPFDINEAATNMRDDTDGYCVIRCVGAKMISSGAQSNVPN